MSLLTQEQILDACDEHLKSLKDTVRTALIGAVLFWWAGYQKADTFTMFEMAIPLRFAQYVAIVFYLFINLSVLDKLIRIRNLVALVHDHNFQKVFSKIALFAFFANPYSYFGNAWTSRLSSGKGFGVLIVIWWVCNSSIYILSRNTTTIPGLLLQGLFLLLGLGAMRTILDTNNDIMSRLKKIDETLYQELFKIKKEQGIITFICIAIGTLIAYLTNLFVGV